MADDDRKDQLLDHDYDGIREYDNPMPRWWLWIFYATIIFVPIYYLAPGNIGAGPGMVAEYEQEMARHAERQAAAPATGGGGGETDADLLALAADGSARDAGAAVFAQQCAACHGADGGGIIGPNLTDDAWIHGSRPTEIIAIVRTGVLEKGMPPWDRILRPEQVRAVTAYVISLHGTTPAAPKAPEGTVQPAPTAAR